MGKNHTTIVSKAVKPVQYKGIGREKKVPKKCEMNKRSPLPNAQPQGTLETTVEPG